MIQSISMQKANLKHNMGDPTCPIFQFRIYNYEFCSVQICRNVTSALEWQWHKLYNDVKLICITILLWQAQSCSCLST